MGQRRRRKDRIARFLPACPPIRNGEWSQAGGSAQVGPFLGKEMSAMGRRACMRVSSLVRGGAGWREFLKWQAVA